MITIYFIKDKAFIDLKGFIEVYNPELLLKLWERQYIGASKDKKRYNLFVDIKVKAWVCLDETDDYPANAKPIIAEEKIPLNENATAVKRTRK